MHENEILVFLLATVVLIFIVLYRNLLVHIPAANWLFSSYLAAWVAWFATNVEHLFFPQVFNVIEHIGYACNGLLLVIWCCYAVQGVEADAHD